MFVFVRKMFDRSAFLYVYTNSMAVPYWPYRMTVNKVFLLSASDAPETVKLEQPILNDITSSGGQRIAFTQNQRYVSLDALLRAKKTSELKDE